MNYFVQCGLYEVFLLQRGRKGFELIREDADGVSRCYIPTMGCNVNLEKAAIHGCVAVAAQAVWFKARSGRQMARLNDLTVVGSDLLEGIVSKMAIEQGWQKMSFTEGEGPKGRQMEYIDNGHKNVADGWGFQPPEGIEYWTEAGRDLTPSVSIVHIKFPVL